ncbi:hypothetical protein B0H19DRAFT_1258545 [Mycena capillaripes]|nr:hypothetical protein B0H19DRAFT_1258545 [Mycena capillaripes]
MVLLQRVYNGIGSFRLGYSPQRPYPWRRTTPIALGTFLLMTALLGAINGTYSEILLPLSAYETDQELTYRPNDTLPSLPLSYMVPQILQHPTAGFTPQILTVGDTVRLNNSVFNFTVTEAFDTNAQPVSSFSYYNNPFSSGCDITNMTANLIYLDAASVDLTVQVTQPIAGALQVNQPIAAPQVSTSWHRSPNDEHTTDIFAGLGGDSFLPVPTGLTSMNSLFQNTFQSLYHLVRLELGVILENQIYASPQMYNDSILDVAPVDLAKISRVSTSNATLMSEWQATVRSFNNSDRAPVMLYVRPVPRLKPLGSAITGVFVSTFAVLSVLWTIFNIVAGAFAGSRTEGSSPRGETSLPAGSNTVVRDSEAQKIMLEEWNESEASLFTPEKGPWSATHTTLELHMAVGQMQRTFERMRRLLKKHGIVEEVDEDDCMRPEDDASPEKHPFLLHRSTHGAQLDSAV